MFTQSNLRQYLLTLLVGASGWLFGFVLYNTAIAVVYNYLDLHVQHNNSLSDLANLQNVRTSTNEVVFTQLLFPDSDIRVTLNLLERNDPRRQVTQAQYGYGGFSVPAQYWSDFGNLSRAQLTNLNLGGELFLQSSNGNLSRYQVINMAFDEYSLKDLAVSGDFHGLIIMMEFPGELFGRREKVMYTIYVEPVVSFYT